jgi:putative ABC transport system permease protein
MGFAGAPITTFALRSQHFPGATARLNPNLTLAEAQRRIDALVASLRRQYPADYPPKSEWTIRLVPLKDNVVGNVRQSLLFLLGAVGLVLLIGCVNVANLLLARATSRGREMAVRQAIGGGPARLTRQLLTESLVLSVLGGLAGVVVLLFAKPYLLRLVPPGLPRLNDIAISWGVLLFAFSISLVAGLLFGLAPALHVRGLDITRVLKQEGRGSTGSGAQARARRTLVIAELALSLVLMTAAALLLRSFWNLDNAPLGFDAQGVTIIRTRLPYPNDAKEDLYATAADEAPFIRDVLRRVRALPGVQDAAIGTTSSIPLDHPEQDQNVLHVVFAEHAAEEPSLVTGAIVLPDYFRLLRIPLVRGRLLTALDDEHSPSVAVINEAMARRYWPNENPVGKRLKLSPRSPTWATVVGVVADARTETLKSERVPVIYASVFQRSAKHLAIYLRGKFTPAAITDQVRHEVGSAHGETVLDEADRDLRAHCTVACRARHLRRDRLHGQRAHPRAWSASRARRQRVRPDADDTRARREAFAHGCSDWRCRCPDRVAPDVGAAVRREPARPTRLCVCFGRAHGGRAGGVLRAGVACGAGRSDCCASLLRRSRGGRRTSRRRDHQRVFRG